MGGQLLGKSLKGLRNEIVEKWIIHGKLYNNLAAVKRMFPYHKFFSILLIVKLQITGLNV